VGAYQLKFLLRLSQSLDGKVIFLCSGNTFRKFSTSTGASIGPHFRGHAAEVTALAFRPGYQCRNFLLSASLDCTLRAWDVRDASVTAVYIVPGPVVSLAVSNIVATEIDDIVYISCWQRVRKGQPAEGSRVYAYSLGKGRTLERLAKLAAPPALVMSHRNHFLGTFERHTVLIWPLVCKEGKTLSNRSPSQPIRLHHTKNISVLAFSFSDQIIAAGDITGRILLWRNFYNPTMDSAHHNNLSTYVSGRSDFNEPLCSTLHWHSQPVACLAFSSDGTRLLSGGSECVLVVWHLNENHRSYLPRLGAPLCSIYQTPTNPTEVCVACSDNALRFLSLTSMKVDCVIQGVRPSKHEKRDVEKYTATSLTEAAISNGARDIETALDNTQLSDLVALEPASGCLAFSSGSNLQLFDQVRDRHISDIQVSKNKFSNETGGSSQTFVSHAAFSNDGAFLATVDGRSERQPYTKLSGRSFQDGPGLTVGVLQQGEDRAQGYEQEVFRIWERWSSLSLVQAGRDEKNGGFNCVCVCHGPHNKSVAFVTVCRAGVGGPMICTVSRDGDIKIWKRMSAEWSPKCAFWSCCSTMSHKITASSSLTHTAAFSTDGSLLATTGNDVVLWKPDGCCLQRFATPGWFKMVQAASCTVDTQVTNACAGVETLTFVGYDPLLLAMSPMGLVLWDILTASVFRAIRMSCMHICQYPERSWYVVAATEISSNLVIGHHGPAETGFKEDPCLMLRFEGADGRLACWWECSFGRPIAMLSSSESEVDAVIISKDRRIFEFGTSTDTHLGASGFRDHLPERNESLAQCFGHTTQKIRCMAVEREASLHKVSDVTSFSLRQLANTKEKMQDLTSDGQGPTGKPQKNTSSISRTTASHALPPLTILVPFYMDSILLDSGKVVRSGDRAQ